MFAAVLAQAHVAHNPMVREMATRYTEPAEVPTDATWFGAVPLELPDKRVNSPGLPPRRKRRTECARLFDRVKSGTRNTAARQTRGGALS